VAGADEERRLKKNLPEATLSRDLYRSGRRSSGSEI
jgi:hypothetical protein